MKAIVKRLRLIYIYYFVSEFVFTPAIRWYRMPNLNVRFPRYPSPASEPVESDINN